MPSPVFWIVVVLAAVLLTTSHLCLGYVLGRRAANREVIRKTHKVLSGGVAQSTFHESVADQLLEQVEHVATVCRSLPMPSRELLDKVMGELVRSTAVLCEALHKSTLLQEVALNELAQPTNGAARSNGSPWRKARFALEIEDDEDDDKPVVAAATVNQSEEKPRSTAMAASPPPATRTSSGTIVQQISQPTSSPVVTVPRSRAGPGFPATSLSADEVERMRTAGAPVRDARRDEVRFPYYMPQFVAEVHDRKFPPPEAFRRVMCRDIARSGISFFSTTVPVTDDLIISLGVPPDVTFVVLRVVNHRLTTLDGVTGYTIGCTLAARVGQGIYVWNAERGCIDADREKPPVAGEIHEP